MSISEEHGHRQFEGDPATAGQQPDPHPPLYNREVLGFFPYQATDSRFVVALYVMTRNLARLYRPDAPASQSGVRGTHAKLALSDPLTGQPVPLKTLAAEAERVAVEVPLTDSPRLLVIDETPR